jgi:hypothetical protein
LRRIEIAVLRVRDAAAHDEARCDREKDKKAHPCAAAAILEVLGHASQIGTTGRPPQRVRSITDAKK